MPDPHQWILIPIWLLGIALWLAAWTDPRLPTWPGWRVAGPPLAILALAAALRLWNLGDFQPLQVDELTELEQTVRHAAERPWVVESLRLFAAAKNADQMLLPEYLHGYVMALLGVNINHAPDLPGRDRDRRGRAGLPDRQGDLQPPGRSDRGRGS